MRFVINVKRAIGCRPRIEVVVFGFSSLLNRAVSPADVQADFGNASILRDGRVVFNIAGNQYRLVALVEAYERTLMRDADMGPFIKGTGFPLSRE